MTKNISLCIVVSAVLCFCHLPLAGQAHIEDDTYFLLSHLQDNPFTTVSFHNFLLHDESLNQDIGPLVEYASRMRSYQTFDNVFPDSLRSSIELLIVAHQEVPYAIITGASKIQSEFNNKSKAGAAPTGIGFRIGDDIHFIMFRKKTSGVCMLSELADPVFKMLLSTGEIIAAGVVSEDMHAYSRSGRQGLKKLLFLPVPGQNIVLYADSIQQLKGMYSAGIGKELGYRNVLIEHQLEKLDLDTCLYWEFEDPREKIRNGSEYIERNALPDSYAQVLAESQESHTQQSSLQALLIRDTLYEYRREEYIDEKSARSSLMAHRRYSPRKPYFLTDDEFQLVRMQSKRAWEQDGSALISLYSYPEEALEIALRIKQAQQQDRETTPDPASTKRQ